jgi:hypothetical protein
METSLASSIFVATEPGDGKARIVCPAAVVDGLQKCQEK